MADDQQSDFVPSLWEQVLSAVNQGNMLAVLSLLEKCLRDELPRENCWVHTLLNSPLTSICHLKVVELLVERFPEGIQSLKGSPDGLLEKALVIAIRFGDDLLVERLLTLGADANLLTQSQTPLTIACLYRRLNMVKLLLKNGANVNLKGRDDLLPLSAAMIIQEDMGVEIMKCLIDHGADINLQAERGTSALHRAVLMGKTEVVKLLLARRAQVLRDDNGFTPLFLAVNVHLNDIFNVILSSDFVSLEDKVNMLEFKAASLAPNNMDGVYQLLRQAMEKRYKNSSNILKKSVCEPVAAFGNVVESQNLEELETRKHNHDVLLKECLAVQDRLLGRGKMCLTDNFYTIWKKLFDAGQYDEAMSLVEYGIEFLPFNTAARIFSDTFKMPNEASQSQSDSVLSIRERVAMRHEEVAQKFRRGRNSF